jgi:hypothetical protein
MTDFNSSTCHAIHGLQIGNNSHVSVPKRPATSKISRTFCPHTILFLDSKLSFSSTYARRTAKMASFMVQKDSTEQATVWNSNTAGC